MKDKQLAIWIIIIVLLVDQAIKFWVKTNMLYGATFSIFGTDWALIHFVENDGMAFGKKFNIPYGKVILSLFRIVAVAFLIFFLQSLLKSKVRRGVIISFALILAGAIGNVIDSAFYGLIFSRSFSHGLPAVFLPLDGGYAPFLYGSVVDMFYFPILEGHYPAWFPIIGEKSFIFFRPVFNIADVAISWGVLKVLFFHRSFFMQKPTEEPTPLILEEE